MENQTVSENTILENKLIPPLEWGLLRPAQDNHFLGNGSFGVVLKYTKRNDPFQNFAVKLMKTEGVYDEEISNEIKALEKVQTYNQYFPKYFGHVKYRNKSNNDIEYALVFELAQGNLKEFLKIQKYGLTFQENLELLGCLSMGLFILKEKGIAHRDIKPSNILYFQDSDNQIQIE